ncbi:MAG: thiamine pyrophosphate-dependent enzyme [Pseudomonadota bacterium]
MSSPPDIRLREAFRRAVAEGQLPHNETGLTPNDVGLSGADLTGLFESQLKSRHMDLLARRLGRTGKGFYSIGSSGHEGNAAFAHVLRTNDMAFLHYRSGGFLLERQRKGGRPTPLWDMALSLVASAEDPVSGGRHKVIGDHRLFIPPQTSTIASHLPKAVGAAFSVSMARTRGMDDTQMPQDAVVICSFGDASANHSTAVGALNAAAHGAYRGLPIPLIFLCEDNGIGISVPTPQDWIAATYGNRAGLHFVEAHSSLPRAGSPR